MQRAQRSWGVSNSLLQFTIVKSKKIMCLGGEWSHRPDTELTCASSNENNSDFQDNSLTKDVRAAESQHETQG